MRVIAFHLVRHRAQAAHLAVDAIRSVLDLMEIGRERNEQRSIIAEPTDKPELYTLRVITCCGRGPHYFVRLGEDRVEERGSRYPDSFEE